jgi:hypothetical protein
MSTKALNNHNIELYMLHFTHYYVYIMEFMENLNVKLNVFLVFHFHLLLTDLFIFIFINK